ncbi:hypothetical protein GCM10009129_05010 [Psychrobacter aestuarii]|uniref:DUF4025 domain-containing protein n=2 Tax=Psychrobacter aestuarii TaxID=556327 RepID=A0ABP3F8S5_9GAMM
MKNNQHDKEERASQDGYTLQDADDNHGVTPDDALEKVNPAAAARKTPDHDPHGVAKKDKDY